MLFINNTMCKYANTVKNMCSKKGSQFTLNKINIVEKLGGKEKAQEYLTKYFNLAHERLMESRPCKVRYHYKFLFPMFVICAKENNDFYIEDWNMMNWYKFSSPNYNSAKKKKT